MKERKLELIREKTLNKKEKIKTEYENKKKREIEI